ncbi:MAG: anaerobic ribonucleoside-triphosphate reductase activating protein [Ruminococcaceae bacterium]|nr:anaerobic ribonucleoside-triphosphate reductase activating protein [Oscillospiraceae bacterium]
MNYGTIKKRDIANGPGVRVSLFVSGCTHHCPGCFNADTWDFDYGTPFTAATEQELVELMAPNFICGLSLLGGEPMEPRNQAVLLPLLRRLKQLYPQKTVWCYSGYTLEELQGDGRAHSEHTDEMLSLIDVLVDGRFVLAKKDIRLRFRGSSNQRLIDLNKTRATGEITLWDD